MTEQFGAGLAHQVLDSQAVVRLEGDLLRTVCGLLITPAPLSAPVGEPCPVCSVRLGTSSQEEVVAQPLVRSRLRRLLSLFGG